MISQRGTVWLVAASCAVGLFAACGDDEESVCIGDESVIVAINPESIWIYRVTDRDTANAIVDTHSDTILIVKDTIADGDPWSVTSIDGELWANRADGFWVWSDPQSVETEPYLLARFPAALGQQYAIPAGELDGDTMLVADMMAIVRVPYGQFTAITYQQSNGGHVVSLRYFVRGIGLVKEIAIIGTPPNQVLRTRELLKFRTAGC
ncbi:MAG TPA: hypothetical protein VNN55_04025 [bacterium]|nr:hypothetical protein [bacterium]